jgi:HSP20 family protein
MNIRRIDQRYRPARSLSLLNQLLQEPDFSGLLNPTLATRGEPDAITDWVPAVDIREETDRFVLHADLPGVDPENIEVTMEDGVLTIQGSRDSEHREEHDNYQRYERVSGKFLRRFSLPDTANGDEVAAITKHGVLEVTIPKQHKVEARKIDVKSA